MKQRCVPITDETAAILLEPVQGEGDSARLPGRIHASYS